MSLTSFIITASESGSESGMNPILVGVIALSTLLFMLMCLLMIAGGRGHN